MPVPTLTATLDTLEARLPTVPSRILRLQRTLAGAACDRTTTVVTTVTDTTRSFLDSARTSGKTVTGQARAAADDVMTTARTGIKTVAGQARAAGGDVADTARTQSKMVTGQSGAQGRKLSKDASAKATALVDSAIDAIDDDPGTGTPYEQWTKAQLMERARQLDVEGRTGLNKRQLIVALRNA